MKVICTKVPLSPTGEVLESSPWVTVDTEYLVVAVIAEPARQVLLQIVTDDGSLGLFDSANFMTVDCAVPETWRAQVGEDGVLEFAPAAWLAPGFWEAYYDGEQAAVEAVKRIIEAHELVSVGANPPERVPRAVHRAWRPFEL